MKILTLNIGNWFLTIKSIKNRINEIRKKKTKVEIIRVLYQVIKLELRGEKFFLIKNFGDRKFSFI